LRRAFLERFPKAGKIASCVDAVPLDAAFALALIVLPAVLGGDAQDDVLLLVLVRFGFSVVTVCGPMSSVRLYMLVAPVLRDFPLGSVHACPEGVPARPTPKATEEVSWNLINQGRQ
jgi:hypothetical protein